jgi:hypothetical protein
MSERRLASGALAEGLPKAVSGGLRHDSGRAEPPLPSVNEVVDRSGFEPLTSAVQTRQL